MSDAKWTISLNTVTEEHVHSMTWVVDEHTYDRYKADMVGQPESEQIASFDLIDDMLADGRHIAI
jgi:hypothetical protein